MDFSTFQTIPSSAEITSELPLPVMHGSPVPWECDLTMPGMHVVTIANPVAFVQAVIGEYGASGGMRMRVLKSGCGATLGDAVSGAYFMECIFPNGNAYLTPTVSGHDITRFMPMFDPFNESSDPFRQIYVNRVCYSLYMSRLCVVMDSPLYSPITGKIIRSMVLYSQAAEMQSLSTVSTFVAGVACACAGALVARSVYRHYDIIRKKIGTVKRVTDKADAVVAVLDNSHPLSSVILGFLPDSFSEMCRHYGINVVHAGLFAFDVFSYWHGCMPFIALAVRASEVFGFVANIFIGFISIVKDLWDSRRKVTVGEMQAWWTTCGGSPMASTRAIVDMARDFNVMSSACRNLKEFILKIFEWMPNFVRKAVAKLYPEKAWAVICSDLDVRGVMTEIDNLLGAANIRRVVVSQPDRERFYQVASTVREIRRRLDEVGGNGELYRHISDVMRRIENVEGTIAATDLAKNERITPLCIVFEGPPGTGKTMVTRKLAHEFVEPSEIYTRVFGSTYWDGYNGQKVVIIDDAFAIGKAESHLEFIQAVSGTAFYPPLASMENSAIGIKGTPLTASVIIVSTNVASPTPTDMPAGRDAIARRRHIRVQTKHFTDPAPYQIVDKLDGKIAMTGWLSYDQLVEAIKPMVISHFEVETKLLQDSHAVDRRLAPLIAEAQVLESRVPVGDIAAKQARRLAVFDEISKGNGIVNERVYHDLGGEHVEVMDCDGVPIFVTRLKEPVKPTFDLPDDVASIVFKIGGFSAVCASLYGLYRLWSSFGSVAKEDKGEPQGTVYSEGVRRKLRLGRVGTAVRAEVQGVQEERAILQSFAQITIRNGDDECNMNCLHTQSVIILPRHAFHGQPLGPDVILHCKLRKYGWGKPDNVYEFSVPLVDCAWILDEGVVDLASIPLPRHIPRAPNHASYFQNDISQDKVHATLCSYAKGMITQRSCIAERNSENCTYGNHIVDMDTDHTWWYALPTMKGDCGSLLLGVINGRTTVLGLHVAASRGRGCAVSIGLNEYNELCSIGTNTYCEVQGSTVTIPDVIVGSEITVVSNGEHSSHVSGKTALRPSMLYGVECVPPKVPAALAASDPRILEEHRNVSPLHRAVAKYSHPGRGFDKQHLAAATAWAKEVFNIGSLVPRRIFTEEESINGIPSLGFKGIEMATSPGYPYKKTGRKVDFFSRDGLHFVPGPVLRKNLDQRYFAAVDGRRVQSIWADSLKDELRPIAKVQQGKTRLVTCPPLDFSILFRQYFGSFIHHVIETCLLTPSAVGIDANSLSWHEMILRLKAHPHLWDSDISNNDGDFPAELTYAVLDVIEDYYSETATPVEMAVRQTLIDEVVNTFELAGTMLYMKGGGNPSGNPGTTIFNTIGNAIMLAYCWFTLCPRNMYSSRMFNLHCTNFLFGDDHAGSVSSIASEFYEPSAISAVFSSVGRTMTASTKKSGSSFIQWSEFSFLSRYNTLHPDLPGMNVSLLKRETLLSSAQYIRDKENPVEAVFEVANDMLCEWAHYGREEFRDHEFAYKRALGLVMDSHYLVTYDVALQRLRNAYYAPNCRAECQAGEGEKITQNVSSGGEEVQPILNAYSRMSTNVPDFQWNLQNIADRFVVVGGVGVAVGTAAGTQLAVIDIPTAMLSSTFGNAPWRNFHLARTDCKIRVDCVGSKFHTGKILCGGKFGPLNPNFNLDMYQMLGGTHAIIDINGASSTIIDFPYFDRYPMKETTVPWFQFWVSVLTPIQAAAGAEGQIDLTFSAAFPNAQFAVPKIIASGPPGVAAPLGFSRAGGPATGTRGEQQGNSISNYRISNFTSGGNLVAPTNTTGDAFDARNATDPTLSTAVGVGGSQPSASIVPPVASGPQPPTLVGQTVGATSARERDMNGLAKDTLRSFTPELPSGNANSTAAMGTRYPRVTGAMDLEGNNFDPIQTWNFSRPNMFNACNIEPIHQLKTYAGSQAIVADDDFNTVVDEMRVDLLVRKPGWLASFSIPISGSSAFDEVFRMPVVPAPGFYTGAFGMVSAAGYSITQANYTVGGCMPFVTLLSSLCQYWTGDLEITFLFSTGSFSTGKLLFVYSGVEDGQGGGQWCTNISQAQNQYSIVYDLSSSDKRLTIRIPWMQKQHAMRTRAGPALADYEPLSTTNGYLQIFILNSPVVNTGQPSLIPIDIFIAGGPNFQLSGPAGQNSFMFNDDCISAIAGSMVNAPWPNAIAGPGVPTLLASEKFPVAPVMPGPMAAARGMGRAEQQGGDDILTAPSSTSTATWSNEAIVIVPKQRVFSIAEISGERFASVRDLFKKRWLAGNFIVNQAGSIAGTYVSIYQLFATCPYRSLLSSYYGFRGSLRMTIEIQTPQITAAGPGISYRVSVVHVPWAGDIFKQSAPGPTGPYTQGNYSRLFQTSASGFSSAAPLAGPLEGTSIIPNTMLDHITRKCVTLEVPWNFETRIASWAQVQTAQAPVGEGPWGWLLLASDPTEAHGDCSVNIYVGFGDDFRLGRIWRNPFVITSNRTTVLSPWW